MKWFALIVLALATAAALVSVLPSTFGRAGGEEASRFIDVELTPAHETGATYIAIRAVMRVGHSS